MRLLEGARDRLSFWLVITVLMVLGGLPTIAAMGGSRRARSLAANLRYGPGFINHPVNVVPTSAILVPEDWPVARDGSITCLTCHQEIPSFDGSSSRFLRGTLDGEPETPEFCRNCHTAGEGSGSAATMHWMAVGSAHIRSETPSSLRSAAGSLDAESQRCLSCHDGVTAAESHNAASPDRSLGYVGNRSRSHPIGVGYPSHTLRGSSASFRSAGQLPEKVRLPEGKVSCVSCHDLYARDRHRLSVPIEGSALCFTCHEMD